MTRPSRSGPTCTVPVMRNHNPTPTLHHCQERDNKEIYVASLYWALTTMSTIGCVGYALNMVDYHWVRRLFPKHAQY